MSISELITTLEDIKKEYGDIDVEYSYNDGGYLLTGSAIINEAVVEKNYGEDTKVVLA